MAQRHLFHLHKIYSLECCSGNLTSISRMIKGNLCYYVNNVIINITSFVYTGYLYIQPTREKENRGYSIFPSLLSLGYLHWNQMTHMAGRLPGDYHASVRAIDRVICCFFYSQFLDSSGLAQSLASSWNEPTHKTFTYIASLDWNISDVLSNLGAYRYWLET